MSCRGDDSGLGRVVLTVNVSCITLQWGDCRLQLVSHRGCFLCMQGVVPTGPHVDVRIFSQRSWHLDWEMGGGQLNISCFSSLPNLIQIFWLFYSLLVSINTKDFFLTGWNERFKGPIIWLLDGFSLLWYDEAGCLDRTYCKARK